MMTSILPLNLTGELGLQQYWKEVQKFPLLSNQEEYNLAQNYRQTGNIEAAHKLVTSHLRYVVKVALKYRGYGLPMNEIIAEGNIGLMQAVKKFDPTKGFRLATYAIWWIKATMQEYILKSWSLVRIGTTINQKKLFFNLKKLKAKIQENDQIYLSDAQTETISKQLNVTPKEVVSMEQRLIGDSSLNAPIKNIEGNNLELQDTIADVCDNQEILLLQKDEQTQKHNLLEKAIATLKEREQAIIRARRLQDPPATLESLSMEFSVSRERIRQIEERAFEKLQKYLIEYK
ncbi:RNA polymerase sigma factor RpoH [Bartonella sp. DGB1]|uniref:RNA polymerase sigma factor RpoH n=1 Tax=Bartonella sp. DGB1 TaxID=3239807 RepID=UPI003524E61A